MKKLEKYYAGINFGGWYSQCDYSRERFDNFIKDEDFAVIKKWGFDHVRIPVDYNLFETIDGEFIEEGFERIEHAIALCRQNGLNMILDLHKAIGFSFDDGEAECGLFENEKYQHLFYDLWREIARRFAKHDDMLAFELLNEVTDPGFMPKWNEMAGVTIGIIREYSRDIKILVGGFYNNAPESVPYIDVPVDENIVFNFHCYEPILYTHQGAYWINDMDTSFRMKYKTPLGQYKETMTGWLDWLIPELDGFDMDAVPDSEYFKKRFADAVAAAEAHDVYLYCGEYGVIELADLEGTREWYSDIHEAFRSYGIGHALWSYREMDFSFDSERMDPVRGDIIRTSIGE